MSNTPPILRLSVELFVETFNYLSYQDLIRCRQVSRTFRSLVCGTPALQYTLELGLTGYDDALTTTQRAEVHSPESEHIHVPIPQRLATLRTIQSSWRQPYPRLSLSLTVPSQDWFEARWFKDVLAGRVPGDVRRLDIFYAGGGTREMDRLRTLRFDVAFDAACIDPGQDLVVLTRSAFGPNQGGLRPPPRVYLRSLRNQGPHPRARQSFIDLAGYGFPDAPFARRLRIQISGEYLTISIFKQLVMDAVLVWHWPSGTINAMLRPPANNSYLSAFCTPTGYLLVVRHRRLSPVWFGIHVYHLSPYEETPRHLVIFALPALRWDPGSMLNATFYPSYNRHGMPVGGTPTYARRSGYPCWAGCALVQLKINLQYTLYTPVETFVSVARSVLEREQEAREQHQHGHASVHLSKSTRIVEPVQVQWVSWGPTKTRIIDETHDSSAVVCGYRAVYTEHILDFCPWDVATDAYGPNSAMHTGEDNASRESDLVRKQAHEDTIVHSRSPTEQPLEAAVVTEPSILHSNMFTEPVVTKLPYRRTTLNGLGRLDSDTVQIVLEDIEGPKHYHFFPSNFVPPTTTHRSTFPMPAVVSST